MEPMKLAELSDEDLLKEAKSSKSTRIFDAVLFGFLVGVAIYSSVANGFGLLTFLPLVYLPIAARNNAKNKKLNKILQERGLK